MKNKTLLFLSLIINIFVFSIGVEAKWYWNTPVSFWPWAPILKHCPSDWDSYGWSNPTYWEAAVTNNSSSLTPISWKFNKTPSWTMYCLKWDSSDPTWSITYFNWWTNTNSVTISFWYNDKGWSWFKNYTVQRRVSANNPSFTSWWSWSNLSWCVNKTGWNSCTDSSLSNHTAYQYRIILRDVAWNFSIETSWNRTVKIDRTPPSASDVSTSIANNWYFKATNSQSVTVSVDNSWWSPINRIEGRFEKHDSPGNYNWIKSSNNSTLTTTENISIIDNNRDPNNYRTYKYLITEVCDQAWNCTNNITNFSYNAYAWYYNSTNSSLNSPLNFVNEIADWTNKNLTISLRDDFNNRIVPVYRSNWSLLRSVNISFDYNNSLYLNQYSKIWESWVSVTWVDNTNFSSLSIWQEKFSNTISSKTNNNWNYLLIFRVYSPTYDSSKTNWQQFVDWNFSIDSISLKLSDKNTVDDLYWSIKFDFSPVYTTNITWSILENWIIVWSTQESNISVNNWWTKNIFLEYGYYDSLAHKAHSKLKLRYKKNTVNSWTDVVSWKQSNYNSLTNFWTSTSDIITQVTQDWTLNLAEQNTYFATHIRALINWKQSVYSSDIYWMDRYVWFAGWDNTSQRWVKIHWLTHSQKQEDLVVWQSDNDYSVIWNLEKSQLQQEIRKNSYWLINEVTPNNWTKKINNLNQNSPWKRIGDILYFGWLWWDLVELNLNNPNYSWAKTILIEWWDLYIKSNILANNLNSDILWIAVLKDIQWRWGNIFIDNNVLEINAVLYADKSLISTDSSKINSSNYLDRILSPENWGTYDNLDKQLYLYWSLFSNNTIWWSTKNPYLCPYFVTINCSLDISQKFDLNFTRRWYEIKRNNNYENYPFIIRYNPLIQSWPPPLFNMK